MSDNINSTHASSSLQCLKYQFDFSLSSDHLVIHYRGKIHNLFKFLRTICGQHLSRVQSCGFFVIKFDYDLVSDEEAKKFLKFPVKDVTPLKWKEDANGVFIQVGSSDPEKVDGSYQDVFDVDAPEREWSKEEVIRVFDELPKKKRLYKIDEPIPMLSPKNAPFNFSECFDPLHFFRVHEKVEIKGVNTNYTYVSIPFTAGVLHTEDGNAGSLNVMTYGNGKLWLFMNYANTLKLRRIIGEKYGSGCLGALNTRNYLIPPWILTKWGIDYKFYAQKKNELVVTLGGAGHEILNNSFTVNDSVNYVNDVTDAIPMLSPKDFQCFCHERSTAEMKKFETKLRDDPTYCVHGHDVLRQFDMRPLVQLATEYIDEQEREQGSKSKASSYPIGPRTWKCDKCQKELTTPQCLKRHIENLHEKKTYVCKDCGQTMSSESQLCKHRKKNHA